MIPVIPREPHIGAELMVDEDMMPSSVSPDGLIMSEWQPTDAELVLLMCGGRVRLWQHTGNDPMQPINVEVAGPVDSLEES